MKLETEIEELFRLSLGENGGLDENRARKVCEFIEKCSDKPVEAYKAYLKLVKDKAEKDKASIESAAPLPEDSMQELKKIVLSMNPSVSISVKINPDLIAGVKLSVGDEIVENSVRAALEKLK